jgi:enoyl-CoA hydratase
MNESGNDSMAQNGQGAGADADVVTLERVGDVRLVTLNRPDKRNAANFALQKRLLEVMEAIAADAEARAVVLTGAGPVFCAGGDRDDLQAAAEGRLVNMDEFGAIQHRTAELMLDSPLPMIAAVNGPAAGHGAVLAALCDLVIASENAAFWDPHVHYGLRPCVGLQLIWPMLTSTAVCKELLMTGRRVEAAEAVKLGLASRLCPAGDELSVALEMAKGMAGMPPLGLAQAKRSFNLRLAERYHELVGIS